MCSIPGLPLPGSNVSVLITRVNLNPLCVLVEFWGNFDQDRGLAYERMKKEIQCPKKKFHESEGSPGDLCLVRVLEKWYRARIVSRNGAEYSVFLIDKGSTLRAHTDTLAWGQTEFFYLPPEVEFCVLANVLPLSPENRWSAMALEYLKTFCGRTVTACVQDVIVPQRTFLLDIPCLAKQMFEMGFAKKLSNERFRDFVARSLQYHSGPVETWRTSAVELTEQSEKRQYYMYPELQTETVETVVVTEVTNPLRVFCQLKVFSQELKKLTEQITQHYEGRRGNFFARPENLGSPCASRGSDGRWYRSVLQQVMPSSSVAEVLHVDYGKKQFVPVEHVRPLASEFFRMPVVTYVCSLHGIIDRGVGWTASQIDCLKSLLLNRTVIAKFEYQSLSEGVHYVTLYGDENTNINNLFGFKEKCLIDSKAHVDYAVDRSATTQKCPVLVKSKTEEANLSLKTDQPAFSTESLSPNTSHVVVVQHVDSPSTFWIQTQRYADEFDELMNSLGELYSDPASADGLIRNPVAGLLCVAKSQDDVFYRATVCKVIDVKAEVFFIDYGNTEIVDCFSLRNLPPKYQKLPALAVKCALYGIHPVGEHWDEKAILFFSKAVHDKVLDVHVLAKSQDTHVVQLIDSTSNGKKDLAQLLCSAGFAEIEAVEKAQEKHLAKPCTKMGQSSDMVTTNTVRQSSCSPAVTGTRSVFKEYLFPIGSSMEVNVSHIESPNDFWCQKASNAECLNLLMQDLQGCYANSEFQPLLEAACVARHPENGMWYRALVIQRQKSPYVTVLFIDYGQTLNIAIHDLRNINPAFLTLKGQAFRCRLYNPIHPVSHSTLEWSPDATLQFQEFVNTAASLNVLLKCTVYAVMYNAQKVLFNVVDLETPFQSICNLLVQKGWAGAAPSKKTPLPPLHLDTFFYSTHNIRTGSEEEVRITSVKNVNKFFCQLQRNAAQIEEIADEVNKLCSPLANTDGPKTFGRVCLAKYTDGLWYRGQIISTKPSVVVHFVDYGDIQEVKKSDILPVSSETSEIMSVPVQAVECGLSDMPENVPNEVNSWFKNFVIDHLFRVLVVAKEPCGKLVVELYDGKTQVNAMIKEKFHIEVERNVQITSRGFHFSDRKVQSVSHNETENSSGKNPRMVKTGETRDKHLNGFQKGKGMQQPPTPWQSGRNNRSGQAESTGKCINGDKGRDVLRISSQHGHSDYEKPSESKQANLPLKMVKEGLEAEVFISHCNSPWSFFVQLVADEGDIFSLVEKLNDCQSKCIPINPSDLHEGDLVSAMFLDDNCWYRAVVQTVPTNDKVKVEFIDFGNTAEISVSKIGILDKIFFSYPRYSIHCSLSGLMNANKHADCDFKKEIEKNAGTATCTFIKLSGSLWEVKLEASGAVLGSAFSKHTIDDGAPTDALKSPLTEEELLNISLSACYRNPDISCGQPVTMYASFICGPQHFWCQYAEAENLKKISEIIQKAGSVLETRVLKEESLAVGSGCIALFPEDHLWYRAQVTSRANNTLSVLFVDYGNESEVEMSEVRPLPVDVSDLPPQAFPCQLHGFDPSEGSWDDKADDGFFELITDKLLKVTVLRLSSGLDDLKSPHFVKLECDELVINDVMKKYWIQNIERSLLQVTNASSKAREVLVDTLESTELSTGAEYTDSDGRKAKVKDSDAEAILDTYTNQTHVGECLSDTTDFMSEEASSSSQPDLSQNPERAAFGRPLEGDRVILQSTNEKTENTSSRKKHSIDLHSSVSEHKENNIEDKPKIMKSDLGHVRRVVERKPVGSECVIWSHAHKNWCQAQILKISEDSTLVLLLDHDSEMVVDPVNIFEIVQEEPLQDSFDVDTEVTKDMERAMDIFEERPAAFRLLDSEIKTEEIEQPVTSFPFPEASDHNEVAEEPGSMKDLASLAEEQSLDKEDVSFTGGLVGGLKKGPCHEDVNKSPESKTSTFDEMRETLGADVLAEQQEPFLDPEDLAQSSTLKGHAWTEDVIETSLPVEQQREHNTETSDRADNQIELLLEIQLEKTPGVRPESEPDLALIDEINNFSEDLIDLVSGSEEESDTASDDTVQGESVLAEPLPAVTESSGSDINPANFEYPFPDEQRFSRLTHLTLKVEDTSDDAVVVNECQVSLTEANETCGQE